MPVLFGVFLIARNGPVHEKFAPMPDLQPFEELGQESVRAAHLCVVPCFSALGPVRSACGIVHGMTKRVKKLVKQRKKDPPSPQAGEMAAQGTFGSFPQDQQELVIAFVGAVGVQLPKVEKLFEERMQKAKFSVHTIKISDEIIAKLKTTQAKVSGESKGERLKRLMDGGNDARRVAKDDGILASGAAAKIAELRGAPNIARGNAYFIHSLKHPDEVQRLREIYPRGFYLVGVHADPNRRRKYLTDDLGFDEKEIEDLMKRDLDEDLESGQKLIDTFHLADFFVRIAGDDERLKKSIWRIVDLLFGSPQTTPTFGEYAMYLAFAASLRSGDLSRQVGAVLAKNGEILAMGSNDCPKQGGGLYWPEYDPETKAMEDTPGGRDSARGFDSNKREQRRMIDQIVAAFSEESGAGQAGADDLRRILERSAIRDLTEFGRVVHAEMETLLSCGRKGISTVDTTLYGTTFPCHNCAKHIIAAGVGRVVFIEPYMKSKAIKLHDDAIEISYSEEQSDEIESAKGKGQASKVRFEPFVGVGPRRFLDLFSMNLGAGSRLLRKGVDGKTTTWVLETSPLRIEMQARSFRELEAEAATQFAGLKRRK